MIWKKDLKTWIINIMSVKKNVQWKKLKLRASKKVKFKLSNHKLYKAK